MKNSTKNSIWFFCIGAFAMFLLLSFYQTNAYGRMANHLYCDHSVETLGSVKATGNVYYSHGHRNDDSNH